MSFRTALWRQQYQSYTAEGEQLFNTWFSVSCSQHLGQLPKQDLYQRFKLALVGRHRINALRAKFDMTGETVDKWLDQLTSSDWGKASLRDFRKTDSSWRFSSFSSCFAIWTPFSKAICHGLTRVVLLNI